MPRSALLWVFSLFFCFLSGARVGLDTASEISDQPGGYINSSVANNGSTLLEVDVDFDMAAEISKMELKDTPCPKHNYEPVHSQALGSLALLVEHLKSHYPETFKARHDRGSSWYKFFSSDGPSAEHLFVEHYLDLLKINIRDAASRRLLKSKDFYSLINSGFSDVLVDTICRHKETIDGTPSLSMLVDYAASAGEEVFVRHLYYHCVEHPEMIKLLATVDFWFDVYRAGCIGIFDDVKDHLDTADRQILAKRLTLTESRMDLEFYLLALRSFERTERRKDPSKSNRN
jgi:hypothetical protein